MVQLSFQKTSLLWLGFFSFPVFWLGMPCCELVVRCKYFQLRAQYSLPVYLFVYLKHPMYLHKAASSFIFLALEQGSARRE